MSRLWDKGEALDDLVLRFTVGDDPLWDARLVPYDVRASIAHATMLVQGGWLTAAERDELAGALTAIGEEHARGEWTISREEEDVHTALENRLVERLGELGGRIHLGRSRNDQVLAALRLYLRDAISHLQEGVRAVVAELDALGQREGDLVLPGYTHQQRAMPSTVAAWAGGYATEIGDAITGLEACRVRLERNPLGSAAGYGTPGLDLDRELTRRLCDFRETQEPVTAVQLSRGKGEAQLAFEMTLLMQDLGRLASELCLFATSEFGFVSLPAAMTTGSSIMPQKRNPDVFELVRARSAQAASELNAILALTAKLTSGYHRDLQLVKPPLFRAIDSTEETLAVMVRALPGVRFVPARTRAAMDRGLYAAEAAYDLVKRSGISFREAYRQVGEGFREEGAS